MSLREGSRKYIMRMKQVSGYHSRQHLVPTVWRRVQSGRARMTGNSPVSSSTNPFQARTASNNAEPHVRHGTCEEVLQADTRCLPVCPEQMSLEEIEELTQRREVEFQAFIDEVQQQTAATAKELEKLLLPGIKTLRMIRLRIVAVQILLRACGEREHRTTPSDLFAQLVKANDSGLQRVAASLGMELEQLGQEAEAVLAPQGSREEELPLYDMEDLEYSVNLVRLLTRPTLEELYPHEWRIVEAYEVIKQAVPERFT